MNQLINKNQQINLSTNQLIDKINSSTYRQNRQNRQNQQINKSTYQQNQQITYQLVLTYESTYRQNQRINAFNH